MLTVEKKTALSRYGGIGMNNTHEWSLTDGFRITPYMRDLMLHSGQDDNYKLSATNLEKYLRVETDDSQINRLCVHYGGKLECEMEDLEGEVVKSVEAFSSAVGEDEVVYGMFDGCMLPTRPHKAEGEDIGSWKEMKLGRIFREQDHLKITDKPNLIRKSLYVSHFGKHDKFTAKLEPVIDVFEPLVERLVFINDGATWIENWIQSNYPRATDILDFYHSSEYLHDFSKIIYPHKVQSPEKEKWLDRQIKRLLNDEIEQVIVEIEQMDLKGKKKLEAQRKVLTYYRNNQHRMLYKTYRDRGLLIGSGPIESAHRFVLQKRMKQSGQKWTKKGGQAVANLRVVYLNNQWNRVINLINKAQKNAA